MKKPLVLTIMDGFGLNPSDYGNAIVEANTPNLDKLFAENPHTQIGASGLNVGLPDGQMGNSEVGHTNIGAGRVVYQELTRITKSIEDGDFFQNEALVGAVDHCLKEGTDLHLMGLLSDGGVHSHNSHLYGLLELAKRKGLSRVYVHCLMDGRDVPPTSGKDFVAELVAKMEEIGVGKVATVMGRYYAMDRDNRWERVEKAYAACVYREGVQESDPVEAVAHSYEQDVTDEFIVPAVIEGGTAIKANDSVIFFNFRPDRAREITRALVDRDFDGFVRQWFPLTYVCTTEYDASMPNVTVAFPHQPLRNGLGEYLSKLGLTQLRIAETEKYAHVTYFFNGGVEEPFPGEDRILVPSPRDVPTYDLKPAMSARQVTDKFVEAWNKGIYDLVVCNLANGDMVGHTGVLKAAVEACAVVDECVGRMLKAVEARGGRMLIIADHGNCEVMLTPEGQPHTAHTTNPVPCILLEPGGAVTALADGKLADVAPTLLGLWGMEPSSPMTGRNLAAKEVRHG